MQYGSTRGKSPAVTGLQAVLAGIAPDGGLYMPDALSLPFAWQSLMGNSTREMASKLLGALLPDFPQMSGLVEKAYLGKFETEDLTPTVSVGSKYVLELFRGPTAAFKDVALSMPPQLMTAARQALGETGDSLILTATSGDTGKAALAGFAGVPGTKICVFYPEGGVSPIQRLQMVTQEGENVRVCGIRGNFDDAQTGVKQVFAACAGKGDPALSSANSINVGRLIPQITYYFKAYSDLFSQKRIALGDPVDFSVPTGNFGDILAGFFAKCLGLPVGRLVCASNANDVLTDFIRTGVYDRRRPLRKTLSPSMDILVSSNLERLLYLASDGDCALVRRLMEALAREGRYQIPAEILARIQADFWAERCDDDLTAGTIAGVYRDTGYLCDPHTAAGWFAAQRYEEAGGSGRPMVVLSTASPFKFSGAILAALGREVPEDPFLQMESLSQFTGLPIPGALSGLRDREILHEDVIHKEEMPQYVLDFAKSR